MTRTVYLPIEEPPDGWVPPRGFFEHSGDISWIAVLGPPVTAPPDVSPEARAVLEAAAKWGGYGDSSTSGLNETWRAALAYAATLTPPDPLEEARKALMELGRAHGIGSEDEAFRALSAALDRMKKDPAA